MEEFASTLSMVMNANVPLILSEITVKPTKTLLMRVSTMTANKEPAFSTLTIQTPILANVMKTMLDLNAKSLQTFAEESAVLTETVLLKTVFRFAPAQRAGAAQVAKMTSMSALKTLVSKVPLVLILKADLNVFAKLVLMVTEEKTEMDVMILMNVLRDFITAVPNLFASMSTVTSAASVETDLSENRQSNAANGPKNQLLRKPAHQHTLISWLLLIFFTPMVLPDLICNAVSELISLV
jgi:hypothetical protein